MPLYDYECPAGHVFEHSELIANRNEQVKCKECTEMSTRIKHSHSNPSAMLDYGLGLNREAVMKGTYDPEKPINRGITPRKEFRDSHRGKVIRRA